MLSHYLTIANNCPSLYNNALIILYDYYNITMDYSNKMRDVLIINLRVEGYLWI